MILGKRIIDPKILLSNSKRDQEIFINKMKSKFPNIPDFRINLKITLLQSKIIYNELVKLSLRRT